MDPSLVAAMFAAGMASGFVDAIAGGGGLVMIPALMLSGLSAPAAIATNKVVGVTGVFTSGLRYASSGLLDRTAALYMGVPALLGSLVGARSINLLPRALAEPLVILLLVAITAVVVLRPAFGTQAGGDADRPLSTRRTWQLALAGAAGVVIGAYAGSTMATPGGAGVVRPVFLAVTTVLVGRLLYGYLVG